MTTSDLRIFLEDSEYKTNFNSLVWIYKFPELKLSVKYEGLIAVNEFINQQVAGWNTIEDEMPKELNDSKAYFIFLQRLIEEFLNNFRPQAGAITDQWNQKLNHNYNGITTFFTYDIPETIFLLNIFKEYKASYNGAYKYMMGRLDNTIINIDTFTGAILAYEFKFKAVSNITSRRISEKSALSKTRSDFSSYISDCEKLILENSQSWNKKETESINKIEQLTIEKESQINGIIEKAESDIQKFSTNANIEIVNLKGTYDELLKLKTPIQYWTERAKILKGESKVSLCFLIGFIFLGIGLLYSLLWLTPEGMLKTFFQEDKTIALRWSIIFITFISFLYFGIRILTKITFSSLHLARDAEERERLTHVYISMIKDSSIEKDDRQLVMQALFSRADTGLLKEDSAPLMPGSGGIIERISGRS